MMHDDPTMPDPRENEVSPTDVTAPDDSSLWGAATEKAPSVWPPPAPTYRRRETMSSSTVILIVVLAIALIAGGLGFIIYATTVQFRGGLHAQATVFAHSTAQAQYTAQAQIQGTANYFGTANANIYASATAQVGATATLTAQGDNVTATATAYSSLLAQITGGNSNLNDPLLDNSAGNQWDTTTNTTSSACIFNGTDYEIDENQPGYLQPCFAEATNFTNFAYQADIVIDNGTEAGLAFCANSAKGSYYLFRYDIYGNYALDLYTSSGQATTLLTGTDVTDISTGLSQSNTLSVIVFKGTISLYANQVYLASISNKTLTSGMIGFAALDGSVPTKAEFSNAQVWAFNALPTVTPGTVPSPTATSTTTATPTASPSTTATP
jgi:hypothetical protein